MRPWVIGGVLGAGALLWLAGGRSSSSSAPRGGYTYGGPPLKKGIDRDPDNLIPAFAQKLEVLFQRMRARGFDPTLWEGFRSDARARILKESGAGTYPTLHQYGAAADIVDNKLLWNAPRAFYQALGEEADRLGLTWGGHWKKGDLPHVQWYTIADQKAVYARPPARVA